MSASVGLCAECGSATAGAVCGVCGGDPRFNGRYRPLEVLGRGSAGVTYRAIDEATGSEVALKELPLSTAGSLKVLELADREATVLRQLSHPKIPKYLDHFISGKWKHSAHVLVQELIEGHDLSKELESRRFSEDEVLDVVDELLEILEYLHGLSPPVIHRDLKPRNVITRPDGSHALVDFGSVRDVVKEPELGGSTIAGTFGFMAPEQLVGDASPASDVYAVGALAVNLLTRKQPATLGGSLRESWGEHARAGPAARAALDRFLEPDPTKRPPTAKEARRMLRTLRRNPPSALSKTAVGSEGGALAVAGEVAEKSGFDFIRGGPGSYRASRICEARLEPDMVGEIVGLIEDSFGRQGHPYSLGNTLRWRLQDNRLVELTIDDVAEGARIRLSESFAPLSGGLFGGIVGGGAGGLGGGFAWLAATLGGPIAVAAWLGGTTVGCVALARHLYSRTVRFRIARNREILDRVSEGLRELGAKKGRPRITERSGV
ncbi:MAG: serine/threonine protein kinase [Deltaproteobacteria bacterium]|nr:serine/threonine protein kinase [Deltaproteobacteria bacterium]